MYLIGTDEAGYGPNLGPLVVTATTWEVPDNSCALYKSLERVVTADVACESNRLKLADSKLLYKPRGSLALLEQGVFGLLGTDPTWAAPTTWREIWERFDPTTVDWIRELPWYTDYDEHLPIDAHADEIAAIQERIRAVFAETGIRLTRVASRVVFAGHFNSLLSDHNKAESLSHVTLTLVERCLQDLTSSRVHVLCDKHGGRNRYGALLQELFPDDLVEVYDERRERSLYRFGPAARRREFTFTARGESALPTAFASMVSKYLRELAMRAFNHFWNGQVEDLKPTAGYPTDARRFKQDIAHAQSALGIADDQLWRAK